MSLIRRLWQRGRGPFLAEEWPLSIPQDRKGCALDLPLPIRARLMLHALCKGVPADFRCGFRLGLRLCPLGCCLCMVSRLFAAAFVPVLQQRLSGKRSTPNRSEEKLRHTAAEKWLDIGGSGSRGVSPLRSLGVPKGWFSAAENHPFDRSRI